MDSLLILPSSLSKLGDSFQVDTIKTIFPFKLKDINYNGWRSQIPDIKYFDNIKTLDYENYKNQFKNKIWNFKTEAIAYCSIDCISLYQIINK